MLNMLASLPLGRATDNGHHQGPNVRMIRRMGGSQNQVGNRGQSPAMGDARKDRLLNSNTALDLPSLRAEPKAFGSWVEHTAVANFFAGGRFNLVPIKLPSLAPWD